MLGTHLGDLFLPCIYSVRYFQGLQGKPEKANEDCKRSEQGANFCPQKVYHRKNQELLK
ncbi:hypothetical protein HanRHA438_Chr02g0085341 [Helianthus annuus]|nr:hypothetical protein HanRHA438_Chr02g0085341 [Helianthus annuus]